MAQEIGSRLTDQLLGAINSQIDKQVNDRAVELDDASPKPKDSSELLIIEDEIKAVAEEFKAAIKKGSQRNAIRRMIGGLARKRSLPIEFTPSTWKQPEVWRTPLICETGLSTVVDNLGDIHEVRHGWVFELNSGRYGTRRTKATSHPEKIILYRAAHLDGQPLALSLEYKVGPKAYPNSAEDERFREDRRKALGDSPELITDLPAEDPKNQPWAEWTKNM